MSVRAPIALILPLLASLGACQARIDAPSLAPRPAERQPILDPAPASEPDTPLDPALAGRLSAILAAAEQGQVAFDRARQAADSAVTRARGAAEGSEAWIAAQQAVSALEAARAPVQAQVTAVAELRADPANAAQANRDAIDVAASRIATIDDAQAAAIQALGARLG
jgi:hypothetical protein